MKPPISPGIKFCVHICSFDFYLFLYSVLPDILLRRDSTIVQHIAENTTSLWTVIFNELKRWLSDSCGFLSDFELILTLFA